MKRCPVFKTTAMKITLMLITHEDSFQRLYNIKGVGISREKEVTLNSQVWGAGLGSLADWMDLSDSSQTGEASVGNPLHNEGSGKKMQTLCSRSNDLTSVRLPARLSEFYSCIRWVTTQIGHPSKPPHCLFSNTPPKLTTVLHSHLRLAVLA